MPEAITIENRIEELLSLLERNKYAPSIAWVMLEECSTLLADYSGHNFDDFFNRYQKLTRSKY